MLCIVSLIIALIFFWWFTGKPYTRENFATPVPYMILVGLSGGDVYYADIDVPMNPKWIKSVSGIQDIAGSYGKLYTVTTGGSQVKYGDYDSTTQNSMSGASVSNVSVDDIMNKVAGLNQQQYRYSSSLSGPLNNVNAGLAKSISINGGRGYRVASDGILQYSLNPSTTTWTSVTTSGWESVSLDNGVVCALKTDGTLWCADRNILNTSVEFKQQGTRTFTNISLKGGRLVGVGRDNKTYYSDTYSPPEWSSLPTQPYTTTGQATGAPLTFSKVILMYPPLDARRKRFLGSATSCNANEQRIGNLCYQSCPNGMISTSTKCPYRAKFINAIASCSTGEYLNNECYQPCTTGSIDPENPLLCTGTSTLKDPPVPVRDVAQATSNCDVTGSIRGRYVRIRPTSLISNNKLCIESVDVKNAQGEIISNKRTGSAHPSASASDSLDPASVECPISSTCAYSSTYLSGSKYDKDADGGKLNRSTSLYWDLDLGSIMSIKSVYIKGCNYVPISNTGETSVNGGSTNGDQITGMSLEILYENNFPTTPPITRRSLGPEKEQTIVFNFTTSKNNACYDDCPKMNGVLSVLDPISDVCTASMGGITTRSISVPTDVGSVTPTSPLNSSGRSMGVPGTTVTGTAVNYVNWVPDPSDSNYILTCDNFPGSSLKPISTRTNVPSPKSRPDSELVGEYYNYFERIDSMARFDYILGLGNEVGTVSTNNFMNGVPQRPFCDEYTYIPESRYMNPSTTIANALYKMNTNNTFTSNWVEEGNVFSNKETPHVCIIANKVQCSTPSIISPSTAFTYDDNINACKVTDPAATTIINYGRASLESVVPCVVSVWTYSTFTRTLNAINTLTGINLADRLYSNPKVKTNESIAKPVRIRATEMCLKSDGSLDKRLFPYNGRCLKCASPNEVFYPKGATNLVTWSDEMPRKTLLGNTSYGYVRFYSVDDAKHICETIPDCNGVSGTPGNYSLRSGSSPISTGPTTFDPLNTSSWVKTVGASATIKHGDYKGKVASDIAIPREFADNYVGPLGSRPSAPPSSSTILDMYNTAAGALSNMMSSLGAAAAFKLYEDSINNTSKYYSIFGLERRINSSTGSRGGSENPSDYGVCVGPCDSAHPIHDPIQIYEDTANNLKILYGTTCHDATKMTFDRPMVAPIYTPQAGGTECPNETYARSGSQCIKQCPYGTEDTGTHCRGTKSSRISTPPRYSCPEGTNKVDSICVFNCENGNTPKGGYCDLTQETVSPGSGSGSIKCTKTTHGYSHESGSGVNKWLCDSLEDLNTLVGFSGSSSTGRTSYVNENDIVCSADDPTTGMYYCQTVSEAKNQTYNNKSTDVQMTCQNLKSAYYDLSNNLDILSRASTSAENASQKVATIQISLQSIYNSQCSSGSSSLCTQLNTQLNALSTNINSGSGAIANVSTPIQLAIASRDNLVAKMKQFQCNY
jgi:hypothetical protein